MNNFALKLFADADGIDVSRLPVVTNNLIPNIMQIVFGLLGSIAVIIIIMAGFQYVLSQGNPEKTSKAKNTILYAVIGLVVCVSGVTIVSFVTGKL